MTRSSSFFIVSIIYYGFLFSKYLVVDHETSLQSISRNENFEFGTRAKKSCVKISLLTKKVTGETKGRDKAMETTMKCTMGLLNRADGSARLIHGKSEVLVAVFGPMECVRQKDELKDRASVRVVVDPIMGLSGREEKSFQKVLRSMFESVIVTEKFPRMMIKIVVQKIVDEDSLALSTAINCTCLALLDAGVEMRRTLGAVELEIDTLTGNIVHNNGKKECVYY